MKTVSAVLHISIDLVCPECGNAVDLMQIEEVPCRYAVRQFGDEDYNEEIECSHCGKAFMVDKITW